MNAKLFLMVAALIALLFGVGFMLFPSAVVGMYGNTLDVTGTNLARYFGSALLGLAAVAWIGRGGASAARAALWGTLVASVLGLLVALMEVAAKTSNNMIWLSVVIYLVLAVGAVFFLFVKKV